MLIANTDIKTYLGITASTYDALLTVLCGYAQGFIEGLCGYKFDSAGITAELHDGDTYIYLDRKPVTALTSVKYNSGTNLVPVWTAISADDYDAYLNDAIIQFSKVYDGNQNISIDYTAGWTSSSVPNDLKMLLVRIAARLYERRKSEGVSSESLDGVNINWADFLKEEDKLIIENYKRKILI